MNKIFDTFRPDGFRTINSYLMVNNPGELITFLKNAFYAEELNRTVSDNNEIINSILKIGDSCFMVSRENGKYKDMRTSLYLYVNDVDKMHKRAVSFGAKVDFEPVDMPYLDRQSGIIDPSGNYWWISKRLEEADY